MCGYQVYLALITVAAVTKASQLSCVDNSCVAETGVALLQNRDLRSMKISRVSGISQDGKSLGRCKSYLEGASLTEEGYKLVKAACCFDAMAAFIERYAKEEKKFTICGSGFAPGLALWHSCEGEGATRTFQDLEAAIVDHSQVRCTALSPQGQTCKERPTDCPDYSGVQKPPGCACSRSKFVDLDFSAEIVNNNLGGGGPNSNEVKNEIRYEKIGKRKTDGQDFDLVVTALESSGYVPGNAARNGNHNNAFGVITLRKGDVVDLLFSFCKTGTNDELPLADLAFTIFDIDGKINSDQSASTGYEGIRASEFAGYITEDDSLLKIEKVKGTDQTRFVNTNLTNVGEEPDAYADPMQLNSDQRKAAVMLFFKNVSSFQVTYAVNPKEDNRDEKKSVSMMFAGKSALADHCFA